jgi:hypothetical protein
MESNNYEWFIADTVEAMLPTFSDPKLVLVMCVDMSWTDYGYGEDGNTKIREQRSFKKKLWLIFHRPNNYTKVLGTTQELNHFNLNKEPINFTQFSDHDSCWRSDGFNWMFKTFTEAWDYFDQFGVEGREIDPMVHWHVFGGKPSYWLVENIEPVDKKERWTTDYVVKFDKKIGIVEAAFKYMPDDKEG